MRHHKSFWGFILGGFLAPKAMPNRHRISDGFSDASKCGRHSLTLVTPRSPAALAPSQGYHSMVSLILSLNHSMIEGSDTPWAFRPGEFDY